MRLIEELHPRAHLTSSEGVGPLRDPYTSNRFIAEIGEAFYRPDKPKLL